MQLLSIKCSFRSDTCEPSVLFALSTRCCHAHQRVRQASSAILASMPLSWPAWIVAAIHSVAIAAFGLLAMVLRLMARALQASAMLLAPATPTEPAIPAGQATIGLMSPEKIEALLKLYEKPHIRQLVDELVEDSMKENARASCPAAASDQGHSNPSASSSSGPSQAAPPGPAPAGRGKSSKPRPFPHPDLKASPQPAWAPFPNGPSNENKPADDDSVVYVTMANWAKSEGRFHTGKSCWGLHEAKTPMVQVWRSRAVQQGHTPCLLCKP